MKLIVSLMFLMFLSVLVVTCNATKDIFILAGQSNMAGRGGVFNGKWVGVVPKECTPSPSVLRLSAKLVWEEAREPLHRDIDVGKTCGIGPGLAFANEIVRMRGGGGGGYVVGLVPCAVGGTRIEDWRKGAPLYNQLVRRSIESVRNGGGVIRALLWYQGESDTVREEDAKAYKARMESFIMNIRSDLKLPNLLVIQVALASGEGKFINMVRYGQLNIKLPNVRCVDAKGLRLKSDNLHLTSMSEVYLGIQLAHAYLASPGHHFNNTQIS
ncbi:probable carbohydrate esterase At4g34215 [Vicia villosa]|uniref:probable carbohydrate esterase At4g34215 n=1 Tax=Vicia villosa TaxID=3911 RepID=UPI00273C9D90|nr:probable carbohydrate esterase At4g34215 [Vicia villosa]